jgi:hypothetical protein
MHHRGISRKGVIYAHDCSKWLVLYSHQLGRVFGDSAGFRNYQGNGVAYERNLLFSEWREIRGAIDRQVGAARPSEIVQEEHPMNARHPTRIRHLDIHDPSIGLWATNERCVKHRRKLDVVDVSPPARKDSGILLPSH